MKFNVWLVIVFVIMSSFVNTAQATSALEYRSEDGLVTVYKIAGGNYSNYSVMFVSKSCKVVTQVSDTNFTTTLESLGAWCSFDPRDIHIPNETTDPLIMELDSIFLAGNTSFGGFLNSSQEHMVFLAFWYETTVQPRTKIVKQETIDRGMTNAQKKVAIGYWLFGYGVPYNEANAAAIALVDNNIKAKYNELGLTKIPKPAREVLIELGEAGAEYFD